MKKTILYQRIEAGLIFLTCLYFYHHLHFSLLAFVALLFAVDIFMVGYAAKDNKIGAGLYNLGHSFIVPPLLIVIGTIVTNNLLVGGGLIWAAHIGLDRALGYGLKSESGFTDTHLGKIGKH